MRNAAWRCGLFCGVALLLTAAEGVHAQTAPAKAHGARSSVDDQEARDLFKLGKQAFDEARFERALKYFKDAYDLSGRPGLLSNIGTALDRLRRDQEAIDTYRQYLTEVPDAPNREVIEERVRVIEAAMSKNAAPTTPPPSAAEPAPTAPSPAVTAAHAEAAQAPAAPAAAVASSEPPKEHSSGGITSRWWFWTGLGVLAAGAVVVGVAAASGGGSSGVESPAVLSSATRVREL